MSEQAEEVVEATPSKRVEADYEAFMAIADREVWLLVSTRLGRSATRADVNAFTESTEGKLERIASKTAAYVTAITEELNLEAQRRAAWEASIEQRLAKAGF